MKPRLTKEEQSVLRAAEKYAASWMSDGVPYYVLRGNNGTVAKLVRACARLAKARGKK